MEKRLETIIRQALQRCRAKGTLKFEGEVEEIEVAKPKLEAHGDFATNVALVLASRVGKKPHQIAKEIASQIPKDAPELVSVSVAGPGFINFVVEPRWYLKELREISESGTEFGKIDLGGGRKLQVEFVSANPTGPLHIGHGRGAVYGDVLANVLSAAGWQVTKEYYVNDVGEQIRTLGRSVYLRLRELAGERLEFPPACYQGHYVVELARELKASEGKKLKAMSEAEAIEFCGRRAASKILEDIRRDLAEVGVIHDHYFHEGSLHADAAVEGSIKWLEEHGHVYEEEGALWFRTTAFGDDKDRVLRKSDGALTYFASDVAYQKNKYDRGFERVIDVWGADHAGYVGRMQAAVAALGHDPKSFDAVLIQLVNLLRGGEAVSMSTRAATYETLKDVRDEVGRDVCRYFFLMRSHNAQLDFDLDLAKKETPDNPVFYIQYAHARICSVFKKAAERGLAAAGPDDVDVGLLDLPEEQKIARTLIGYPRVIKECADALEPHKLAFYLLELARMFQAYYSKGVSDDRYRILAADAKRAAAKLYLLKNVQIVLQNALRILGISAPTEMARLEETDD